jgi:hypothetical protein
MSFKNFTDKKREKGLATKATEELKAEIQKREQNENIFPLEVFNEKTKPFLEALNVHYDIPRAFIGLTMLSAYSSAIGTAYTVSTNGNDEIFLPVWACLTGMSSSGKSLAIKKIYKPIMDIQDQFDKDWDEKTADKTAFEIKNEQMDTIIYRDAHIPTLVRTIMPDNYKGVVKYADELIEWINGMNQLSKKEGTDEQFWISSWNCSPYSGIRSGKEKFVLHHPFVNVLGGVQYKILSRLFAKDRDSTGFIFRMLFANTEVDKIAEVNPEYQMPEEWTQIHAQCIDRLYKDLPVSKEEWQPKKCQLNPDAVIEYRLWNQLMVMKINNLEDADEREIQSGIYGKMKEYAMRFAAILHLADKAYKENYDSYFSWREEESIDSETMKRAIKLANYFFQSGLDTYDRVSHSVTAPKEVIYAAAYMKMGKPAKDIAYLLWNQDSAAAKKRMNRQLNKWVKDYPRVFNAVSK